ncbi:SRPBCC domain-containing protein [Streptomyces similanensis]|uniref:Serine/arginine repetitive matrix protein 1 n=1 Tax=Streptomyces similanensis TaxID=1274988 RepID=A0ABP9KH56_9ACTN
MEHEVFVPVPVPRLRAVLADPDRVARALPGFQQDAGAEPVAGRLKLRIGGTSITYRGALRVHAREDGSYAVEGEAGESRGAGAVKLALTLRPRETDGGTALGVRGTASGDGRVAELDPEAVRAAAVRLLDRFARNLAAGPDPDAGPGADTGPGAGAGPDHGAGPSADAGPGSGAGPEAETPETPETPEELATEDFAPLATGDFEAAPDADDAPVPPPAEPTEPADRAVGRASVFDTEVPPSSLDPSAEDGSDDPDGSHDSDGSDGSDGSDEDESDEYDGYGAYDGEEQAGAGRRGAAAAVGPGGFGEAAGPPAEAAHARRTMIGRSAEEVDHAPPRGRYAPVPAPLTVSAGSALRWAAPAAALAVAGAIVVGRALRRRR